MQENRETQLDHPLRHLTTAQFMALGGDAVVYVKQIAGDQLAEILNGEELPAAEQDYHIVVAADGSPLMIGDSSESVDDWLSEQAFGIVSVH